MSAVSQISEITLKFHSDPGHGWLEVSKSFAKKYLGAKYLQISCYSYMRGHQLFLEEDSDAPLLIEALRQADIKVKFEELDTEDSQIRQYDGFLAYLN